MKSQNRLLRLLCLLALLTGAPDSAAGQIIVEFPDPNLEAVIRDALGKPSGPISDTHLAMLTGPLDASGAGISDLTGLEYCVNVTSLYLYDNQISDISPIGGLTQLIRLHLYDNQISDIGPLAGLTNLRFILLLQNNQIGDISALSGLTNLTWLYLWGSQITDIGPLVSNGGINGEDYVDLRCNDLDDVSIYSHIPNLEARGVSVDWAPPDVIEYPEPAGELMLVAGTALLGVLQRRRTR